MLADFASSHQWLFAGQLVLAAFLGGLIGLERERGHRPAGLRTFMLVSMGSALFTILSLYAFPSPTGMRDPARVASQIVVGIGFIGAGTVWRSQNAVKGLTTAAGMWVAAAIGMAVGAGFGLLAAAATVLVLLILTLVQRFEIMILRRDSRHGAAPPAGQATDDRDEDESPV